MFLFKLGLKTLVALILLDCLITRIKCQEDNPNQELGEPFGVSHLPDSEGYDEILGGEGDDGYFQVKTPSAEAELDPLDYTEVKLTPYNSAEEENHPIGEVDDYYDAELKEILEGTDIDLEMNNAEENMPDELINGIIEENNENKNEDNISDFDTIPLTNVDKDLSMEKEVEIESKTKNLKNEEKSKSSFSQKEKNNNHAKEKNTVKQDITADIEMEEKQKASVPSSEHIENVEIGEKTRKAPSLKQPTDTVRSKTHQKRKANLGRVQSKNISSEKETDTPSKSKLTEKIGDHQVSNLVGGVDKNNNHYEEEKLSKASDHTDIDEEGLKTHIPPAVPELYDKVVPEEHDKLVIHEKNYESNQVWVGTPSLDSQKYKNQQVKDVWAQCHQNPNECLSFCHRYEPDETAKTLTNKVWWTYSFDKIENIPSFAASLQEGLSYSWENVYYPNVVHLSRLINEGISTGLQKLFTLHSSLVDKAQIVSAAGILFLILLFSLYIFRRILGLSKLNRRGSSKNNNVEVDDILKKIHSSIKSLKKENTLNKKPPSAGNPGIGGIELGDTISTVSHDETNIEKNQRNFSAHQTVLSMLDQLFSYQKQNHAEHTTVLDQQAMTLGVLIRQVSDIQEQLFGILTGNEVTVTTPPGINNGDVYNELNHNFQTNLPTPDSSSMLSTNPPNGNLITNNNSNIWNNEGTTIQAPVELIYQKKVGVPSDLFDNSEKPPGPTLQGTSSAPPSENTHHLNSQTMGIKNLNGSSSQPSVGLNTLCGSLPTDLTDPQSDIASTKRSSVVSEAYVRSNLPGFTRIGSSSSANHEQANAPEMIQNESETLINGKLGVTPISLVPNQHLHGTRSPLSSEATKSQNNPVYSKPGESGGANGTLSPQPRVIGTGSTCLTGEGPVGSLYGSNNQQQQGSSSHMKYIEVSSYGPRSQESMSPPAMSMTGSRVMGNNTAPPPGGSTTNAGQPTTSPPSYSYVDSSASTTQPPSNASGGRRFGSYSSRPVPKPVLAQTNPFGAPSLQQMEKQNTDSISC